MKSLGTFFVSIGFFALICGPAASANALIELFTAQNCSPCREAEGVVAEASQAENVIAIAYHLDYWDYLGEADPFSDPLFSARQVGYNSASELKELFTPQIWLQGEESPESLDAENLFAALDVYAHEPTFAPDVEIEGTTAHLHFEPKKPDFEDDYQVNIVRVFSDKDMATRALELQDDLSYLSKVNVARSFRLLAEWDGDVPLDVEFELDEDTPVIVFIQNDNFGKVIYVDEFGPIVN